MKKKVDVVITGTYTMDGRDIEESTFAKQLSRDRKLDADSIIGICETIKVRLAWSGDSD